MQIVSVEQYLKMSSAEIFTKHNVVSEWGIHCYPPIQGPVV